MKYDAVTILLHGLLGAFLGALVWFAGLGGMDAWFRGRPNGWIETKAGAVVVILVGAAVMAIAGIFRDKQLVRVDEDEAIGLRFGFKTILKVGLPLALGLYIIWSLLH
jgi:hypothetical protein